MALVVLPKETGTGIDPLYIQKFIDESILPANFTGVTMTTDYKNWLATTFWRLVRRDAQGKMAEIYNELTSVKAKGV